MEIKGYTIEVTGIVQGVGFRPFIFKLAKSMMLNGYVLNKGDKVEIYIECSALLSKEFVQRIWDEAPMLSEIYDIAVQNSKFLNYKDFYIEDSSRGSRDSVFISPDISTCEDCKKELLNPKDIRYRYPFINCTNCGPRFTIIKNIPYDRVNTTMDKFNMCEDCQKDYKNPYDRRYHAQPVACQKCGPELIFFGSNNEKFFGEEALKKACQMLTEGKIVAIKGLGGFHLACKADDNDAVSRLRARKKRDGKPFALMVKDTDTAKIYCCLNDFEKKLLESNKAPIVLLEKKKDCSLPLQIAEKNNYLGIMLPYTPVHILIFDMLSRAKKPVSCLVMTSGNISDEPIYYEDDQAVLSLNDIADGFLTNDRDIFTRTDDSVTRAFHGKEYIIRRSRGYVPSPINCEKAIGSNSAIKIPSVLACGAELKNTFCMNKNFEFYVSHHIGDIKNLETLSSFEAGIEHFSNMFNIDFDILAHDLHPEYMSSKFAKDYGFGPEKLFAVQHHHAHIASCMADNNIDGDVIGVAFDGTGLGEDGAIWGGEFFSGGYTGFKREGHLDYVGMPGGDAAVNEPWRMAASYLIKTGHKNGNKILKNIDEDKYEVIRQMLIKKINTPMTSSVGRLFDAVAGLLGFSGVITYEGQAAIELEYMADKETKDSYRFETDDSEDTFKVCVNDVIKGIIVDVEKDVSNSVISAKFHNTVAKIICAGCEKIRQDTGLNRVALSGGVFQNITLLEKSMEILKKEKFEVFIHSRVPTNDGCISLGQAVIALNRFSEQ